MENLRRMIRPFLSCAVVAWLTACAGSRNNTGSTNASTGGASSAGGTVVASSVPSAAGGSGGDSHPGGTTSASAAGGAGGGGTSVGGAGASAAGGGATGTGGIQSGSGGSFTGRPDGGGTGGSLGRDGGIPDSAIDGARADGSLGPCTVSEWGDPPAGDSKWIDESWASQLSSNVKSRKEWLLDSAILGKGQINVCVRWGATTAPSSDLKTNIGAWVERWFNDWFKNLDGYGCFPYSHIAIKVTGWAVPKGNESWVSDLDSATTKVYTDVETGSTPPNEPKCADVCSFFTLDGKGKHDFPNCPGGEDFHFDYSMWLDDKIPGSGAAAVGGDWGLRMPVADFIALKGAPSSVVEHEIGHGFGFQDYYDWTQDKPTDGSLMIVGSTSSRTPTQADIWLLRRTWKEMKALRSW